MTIRGLPADSLSALRCPVCGAALRAEDASITCEAAHRFDLHRSGYVNLTRGGSRPPAGDTVSMVSSRREFLAAGHYDEIMDRVASAACDALGREAGAVVDSGGGTGEYLAAVRRVCPGHSAVLVEASKASASHVARTQPGVAVVVADVWDRLPLADGCAAVILDVFAPRNGREFARVLAREGSLIVVTPTGDHLRELVDVAGTLTVDPNKDQRLASALGPWFEMDSEQFVARTISLEPEDARAAVLMGPSAAHVTDEVLGERFSLVEWPLDVTVSVRIGVYRHRDRP